MMAGDERREMQQESRSRLDGFMSVDVVLLKHYSTNQHGEPGAFLTMNTDSKLQVSGSCSVLIQTEL